MERSIVGLSSLKPARTRSAGIAPTTSTKRSTLKKRLSSQRAKRPALAKSIGPAMLMKFLTGTSGYVATNEATRGAPMQ